MKDKTTKTDCDYTLSRFRDEKKLTTSQSS